MICTPVCGDNLRALASELSPMQTQNHAMTCWLQHLLLHAVYCEIFDVKHWNSVVVMSTTTVWGDVTS